MSDRQYYIFIFSCMAIIFLCGIPIGYAINKIEADNVLNNPIVQEILEVEQIIQDTHEATNYTKGIYMCGNYSRDGIKLLAEKGHGAYYVIGKQNGSNSSHAWIRYYRDFDVTGGTEKPSENYTNITISYPFEGLQERTIADNTGGKCYERKLGAMA